MEDMRVGELFAGIGGFGLGLERAGMQIAWHSEIEPYACAALKKHWPTIPNYGDVRDIHANAAEPIDVLCGGFPCQNISVAGKGEGIDGPQSGLWREYARLVRELRPRWVVAENVPALRTRGYDRVADDLETAGYTVQAFVVGADDLGAPHRRKRVWIVAYAECDDLRLEQGRRSGQGGTGTLEPGVDGLARLVTDTDSQGLAQRESERSDARKKLSTVVGSNRTPKFANTDRESPNWFTEPRGQRGYGPPQPTICGMDDGLPNRLDENRRQRLAALGNSLIPQIAEAIGRAIMKVEAA